MGLAVQFPAERARLPSLLPLSAPSGLVAQLDQVPASDRMSLVAYVFCLAESASGYLYPGYFLPDAQLNC